VRELPDAAVRPAMFQRLDGRSTVLVTYRSTRPEASDPFRHDEEN
jgi:RNA ligase